MKIYEKDIFDFVWQPQEMDKNVYKTIKNNYNEYKENLNIIKNLLNAQKVTISGELLKKIKIKIREKENSGLFNRNENFNL